MADEFFARLPADSLTFDERRLRSLLHQTAAACSRLFKDSRVSLQAWVEFRMPGEVELGYNDDCEIFLSEKEQVQSAPTETEQVQPAPRRRPSRMEDPPPPSRAPRPRGHLAHEPAEEGLAQEEISLRDAIVTALRSHKGPMSVSKLQHDLKVALGFMRLAPNLPPGTTLVAWMSERIQDSVVSYTSKSLQAEVRLAGRSTEDRSALAEAFLSSLPDDSLNADEQDLRDALLRFLATQRLSKPGVVPTISAAGGNNEVKKARGAFLGSGEGRVTIKEWIQYRLNHEIDLVASNNNNGQWEMHLREGVELPAVPTGPKKRKQGW